jgi:hypothetical protein
MKNRILLTLTAFLISIPSYAAEGFKVDLGLFYRSTETEQTSTSETTNRIMQFRAGYALWSGLYLGASYEQGVQDTGSLEITRSSFGPTIGYMNQGFHVMGTYFINSELDFDNGVVYNGSGMQFDLAYLFEINYSVHIGPQIAYKVFTYDETETGGNTVDLNPEREDTAIDPSLVLRINF